MKEQIKIANRGDWIYYNLEGYPRLGVRFKVKVADLFTDEIDKSLCYAVYAPYGMDLVPVDKVDKILKPRK